MNNINKSKIAVIGLDCKFPGQANGPDQFWEALINKKDGIVPIPSDRWNHSYYYDAEGGRGKTFVNSAGFISGVFEFSPSSFGMSEKEAADLDPQQRLLIQSSWNSIQNAGYKIDSIKERTGVFFGLSYRDYYDFDIAPNGVNGFTAANPLGSVNAIAAGRVAYLLGLNGPAIQLDTICSSSLMTLHVACQSLLNEECDYALSGGVNCILSPHALVALAQMGALSKSAKCQAFSKHADGYIRGEGVGVLLLKRLEDAERDGDFIYGVVEATATNHDGRSNGLTAPNGKAQVKLIESCLKKAALSPGDIGYVEAHGTGTYLGDPVELESLNQVFGAEKSASDPLFVGSVKSNIGHLEPAAGVASLIKSLLILKNNCIPAGLHLEELNPGFRWSEKPIVPVKENRAWQNDKKYIGISAFSMTGANVHAILGKAPQPNLNYSADSSVTNWPVIISAQNATTLNQYIAALLYSINENISIGALSNTFINGREVFDESMYAYFKTTRELIHELEKYKKGMPNVFKKVSLKGKKKSGQVVMNIGNFAGFKPECLQTWKTQGIFTASITKTDRVLSKLLSKSLDELAAGAATELEQKIARFCQAFIFTASILSTLKTNVLLNTSGEGDYLGAVFSEILTVEESLLLFILENGSKRTQLLDRIKFPSGNGLWERSAEAGCKEFWLHKKEDTSIKDITVNLLNETAGISLLQTGANDQLPYFLLSCYAQGIDINRTQLLGNQLLTKVPLPPPPLAAATYISESYRINSRKAPAHFQETASGSVIASILHRQLGTEQDNRKSFISFFSPEQDGFIKDHVVNGVCIFPGSGYISMICEALFYLNKMPHITLKNVQIFQPMSFHSLNEQREVNLDVTYEIDNREAAGGSWEIKSRKDNEAWVTHIKGSFGLRAENTLPVSKEALFTIDEAGLTPVDMQAFYGHLSNWGVKYGPKFRLVNNLVAGERSMKGVVQEGEAANSLFASPELLDACMHALFSAKAFEHYSEPFVPARYDEINFYQPIRGSVYASGLLLKTETDAMKAQFSFCDREGNRLLEITSMEIRKIRNVFLRSITESNAVYEERWVQPDISFENNQQKINTANKPASKDIWVFLNAQQAQQSVSTISKTAAHVPQITLLGQESGTKADNNILSFKDVAGLIKDQKESGGNLVFFAPPIDDINGLSQMFALFKDLLLRLPNDLNVRLCTVRAMAVSAEEEVNPFQTALWGLARTMPIEAKQKWKGVIDISSIHEAIHLLDEQVKKYCAANDQLVLRKGTVYTPILTRETGSYTNNPQPKGNWANAVLITGGLGQMGRVFTEQLVKLGCKKIYLLSRNPAWLQAGDSEAGSFNLSQSQLDFRTYVKTCSAGGISISAVGGKVDSGEDMAALAALLKEQGINDINLIHTAGAITRNKVVDANREELEREWSAKYEGALQLDKHFENFNVGYTLYTSSIASLWSGEGVAGYSSTNLLLDGLAVNRNLKGKRTLSVRFGRFAEKGLMQEHEAQELEASGILTLPMHFAVDKALELADNSALTTPGIMHVDWERFGQLYQLLNRNQLLSSLVQHHSISEHSSEKKFSNGTGKPLKQIITALVAQELEIGVEEVDPSIPLFELGLDSVHSLGIRTDLEQLLKVKLSVSLIYDYNTVDLLSKHLEELTQKVSAPVVENKKEESEAELLQLLMQELN